VNDQDFLGYNHIHDQDVIIIIIIIIITSLLLREGR